MSVSPPKKIYCYVDETGQDTAGRLFVVVAVMISGDRQEILAFLEAAEDRSGGRRRPDWSKSNRRRLEKYLDEVIRPGPLTGRVFYQVFKASREYERLTAETVIHALRTFALREGLKDFKATIIVDGLTQTAAHRLRRFLLGHGIRIDKIRGERDESSAFLRLADAMARPLRRAQESDWPSRAFIQKAKKDGVLIELS
jgi:hypothetical protein